VVKLVDFGIAKARDRLSVTRTGTVKGKFPYMAPEQILEQPVDRRADVFSLGVLLWELTCGQRLYTGVTDYEVLKKILHTPVPRPSEVVPDYPPGLEAIVLGALAREPAARYPTAAALQTVLGKVARQLENAASSARLAEVVRDLSAGEAQVPSPPPAAREDFAVVVDSGDRGTLELDDLVELHDLVEPDEEQAPEATPVRPTGRGWTRLIVLLVLAGAVAATFYLRPELGHEAVDLLRRLRTALASW
jgi:serine/threonine-protein kinase